MLRILVVDETPQSAADIQHASAGLPCEVFHLPTIEEARRALIQKRFELVLCRHHLHDGDAEQLIPATHTRRWRTSLVVMGETPSAERILQAFRSGAVDYLCLPMDGQAMLQRLRRAMQSQVMDDRSSQRLTRLRHALRRMNESRKLISRKVDVLCSDLVCAYGQLAKDLDAVRTQEDYRHAIDRLNDLEQLICATMDWLLKKLGYCNVGIWLRGRDGDFELGAYMKHTIPASKPLLKAIRNGIVQKAAVGPLLVRGSAETSPDLSSEERELLQGQSVLAASTSFLGEVIAVMVLFRDQNAAFTDEQLAQLRQVAPLLGTALSRMMGTEEKAQDKPEGEMPTDTDGPQKDNSDWWKRGEAPPF